ncbi:unnamed protein product [Danaus chrysippus]|uniref:(African queen) hypothetical protein n=1 Tax=Danaus chrysippus TaxID=151541 RepID=A0A8J2R866_9NEOP|nr:unnamed protein product [Danaus chrysippus]
MLQIFVANTVARLQLYMKQLSNSLDETATQALSDSPEYESKRLQLTTLYNRLEAAISPPFMEALTMMDAGNCAAPPTIHSDPSSPLSLYISVSLSLSLRQIARRPTCPCSCQCPACRQLFVVGVERPPQPAPHAGPDSRHTHRAQPHTCSWMMYTRRYRETQTDTERHTDRSRYRDRERHRSGHRQTQK